MEIILILVLLLAVAYFYFGQKREEEPVVSDNDLSKINPELSAEQPSSGSVTHVDDVEEVKQPVQEPTSDNDVKSELKVVTSTKPRTRKSRNSTGATKTKRVEKNNISS